MLTGAIAVTSFLVGLFFFRFWRNSRDRFFLLFALSFWIEAVDRVALGLLEGASEGQPVFYCGRIVAYGLLVVAIWDKNRPRAAPAPRRARPRRRLRGRTGRARLAPRMVARARSVSGH